MAWMAIVPQLARWRMERLLHARWLRKWRRTNFLRAATLTDFFAHLGDAIVTGPTGNNLRDLRILLAE